MNLVIIAVIILLYLFAFSQPLVKLPAIAMTSSEPIKPVTKNPTQWNCYDGYNVPMRKNAAGDVECMSVNAKDCMWKATPSDCKAALNHPAESIKPLACGAGHKAAWGDTGYDNSNHWCAKVKPLIPF
ncbi:MAG: hypothetical protein ACRCZI_13175 [Cetobacterium sp.]